MSIDSKVSGSVLLRLKFILELFSQSTNKPRGLELTEDRIEKVIEKWIANQDGLAILEPLIDLLQVLDIAIKVAQNIGYREMLSESINTVLWILEELGAVEIRVMENEVFNPQVHRAIDIDKSCKHPDRGIVEVCRRGFMVGGSVFCPAEVVVAIEANKKTYTEDPEDSKNKGLQHSDATIACAYISTVGSMLDMSLFFPQGLKINKIIYGTDKTVVIDIFSCRLSSACPLCHTESGRIHSTYGRTPMDLPILGYMVHLELTCHKFFCDNHNCERKIFTERLVDMIKPYARRTNRLEDSIIVVAFASNAESDNKVAKKLSFAISPNTFLRIIRKTPINVNKDAKLIGVDDWAYRKGNNYGTIVCDHESHRPIDIFAERTSDAFEKWLTAHPDIFLATRDRSNSYAKALDKVCPKAIQVADRFHLSKNLLDELKEFGKQIFPSKLRMIEQSNEQENKNVILLPKQEEVKSEQSDKKKEIVRSVKQLCEGGMAIRQIAKEMKLSKGTVSRYIRLDEKSASSHRRTKWHQSGYDQYENDLIELVDQEKNAIDILNTLREKGLAAGKSTIFRWIAQLKRQRNISTKLISQEKITNQSKEQENKNVIELPKQEEVKLQESDKKRKIVRRVKQLCETGMTIKKIAKEMKLAKGTVRRYINLDEESAASRKRTKCHRSGYYQYENDLIDLVGQKKNAVDILKTLREKGLPAGKSTVFRWVAQLKGQGNIASGIHKPAESQEKWVKRYELISCLWSKQENLKPEQKEILANIFNKFPVTQGVYQLIQAFRQMIKTRDHKNLIPWIEKALQSKISQIVKFAKGLKEDFTEVYNALLYPYSNGFVEGHVNRLKMLKRLMFGRAKLDLLKQRVLYQWP